MRNFSEQFSAVAARYPERRAVSVRRASGIDRFTS